MCVKVTSPCWCDIFYQLYTELCSTTLPINASLPQNDLDETTLRKTCSLEFLSETLVEGRRERPDLSRGCGCSSAKFFCLLHQMQITEQFYSRVITGCSDLMRSSMGTHLQPAALTCPLYLVDSLCPFLPLFPPTAHIFWRTFHTSRSNKDESTVVLRHMLPVKGKDCALFWT